MTTAPADHHQRKQDYQHKKELLVKDFLRLKKTGSIALGKKTSNLFRYRDQGKKPKLDVRRFNNVIAIDPDNLTAEVEGMTTYQTFVDETIRLGLMPAVAPELKALTVGGVISGVGLETSSFRYGFVHETVLEMDILTGDGRVITCTKDNQHADLLYGFPNTYGTLGYVLRAKVKLARVKPYVRIQREHHTDIDQYFARQKELVQQSLPDLAVGFIESYTFGPHDHYVTWVTFVDQAPYSSDYTYMNIFYKSIPHKREDYLTTFDYIWRLDADWFWNSKNFGMENKLLRALFGKVMLKSTSYYKVMHMAQKYKITNALNALRRQKTELTIQDVEVSIDKGAEYVRWHLDKIGVLPVIVVPTTVPDPTRPFTFFRLNPEEINVNIGFYGSRVTDKPPGYYNRLIEQEARVLGGQKLLYSDCYYPREEFWEIYDRDAYTALKDRYDPDRALADLFEKVTRTGRAR